MNRFLKIETFYRVFRDVSTSVHSGTRVKEVLDLVVKKTTEALSAKGALLRILNLETHQLELGASYGLSDRYLSKGPVSSEKMITDLYRLNKVIIIEDILTDSRVQYPQEAWQEGIRMMLDLPLTLGNHVVGILRIFFAEKRTFTEEELSFVVSIAEQSALAIDKARIIEAQQARYDQLAIQTEKLSALGRMAAAIAHEINNPLAGVLLYASNLVKKVPDKSQLKEGLEVIIRETVRCKSIIQELLEFSRDREPRKTLSNINSIIEKALRILENEFRLQHISIEKRLSDEIENTFLDENQIEQVFVNLLLNAIQAIEENGQIIIKSFLSPDRNRAVITIEDTGCGIPQQHLSKIFEPFFSTKKKGTGLGLAVSYGIIRNHGGNITVTSQCAQGTCFTIEIPILRKDSSKGANLYERRCTSYPDN
ncbi:MAG: GAF domain-containing protein [Deltaproteobacteria bacterium]|nr:GAF domain-containing protein [Deltaproteobacteria bacterium]MBW2153821.1 GAF domain-containing protein [Deltaproteobacteria bacterium]